MRFPLRQTISIARYVSAQKKKGNKRFPLVLMLEPLHACNLTCSGCGRIREYQDSMSKMVSLKDCLKATDDCGAPVVSVCGGEPLLYPQIKELVESLLVKKRVVYLCTNGQVLKDKLSLFKPHPFFNINVHLDGLASTHDLIVEKKGAYQKAVEGIQLALAKGFTVCTNTTVYKQTTSSELKKFIQEVKALGVHGILISPSYSYEDVADQSIFMTTQEINKKFQDLDEVCRSKKIWSTPLYIDFLQGKRKFTCTPWGNVTYNIKGWKAPCYLITNEHYANYQDFMNKVNWDKFGPGQDKRCQYCMVHCGFEATVALKTTESIKDALRMAYWTLI
ncbi:MAG: adenosyl-hopene transferase HpnH [Pseudomonadota bacterium]